MQRLGRRPRLKLQRVASLLLFGLTTGGTGCIYDSNDRCGDHQVLEGRECVCEAGYGRSGNGCVRCDRDTEDGNPSGPCQCKEGLIRLVDGGDCVEAAGKRCEADADCPDGEYSHCQPEDDAGYCTKLDCEPNAGDCPGDFACNDDEDRTFCERPPSGLGVACSEQSDCEGFEASYCETLSERLCLRAGCADDPGICHGDWVCCDISLIGASLCIPPNELENGKCPVGGTLVPREEG